MGTLIQRKNGKVNVFSVIYLMNIIDQFCFYCKGAAEIILNFCSQVINEKGEPIPLNEEIRELSKNKIINFGSEGLRVLCLAYNEYSKYFLKLKNKFLDELTNWDEPPEKDLILICFVGIKVLEH